LRAASVYFLAEIPPPILEFSATGSKNACCNRVEVMYGAARRDDYHSEISWLNIL